MKIKTTLIVSITAATLLSCSSTNLVPGDKLTAEWVEKRYGYVGTTADGKHVSEVVISGDIDGAEFCENIGRLEKLRYIDLQKSKVPSRVLDCITGITTLEEVSLFSSDVDVKAIARLAIARDDVWIAPNYHQMNHEYQLVVQEAFEKAGVEIGEGKFFMH